jgi:hypothetical protein
MIRRKSTREDAEFFDASLARWVVGVLRMLIAVVGKESLLGLILAQTKCEILGLLRDEAPQVPSPRDAWFLDN